MNIGTVGEGRPQYYDRSPLTKNLYGISTFAGPSSNSIAGPYTVPANKKAFLSFAQLTAFRFFMADPLNVSSMQLQFTPSGGAITTLLFLRFCDNVTKKDHELHSALSLVLLPGDTIEIIQNDGSTGGSISFSGFVHFVEFDF